MVSTKHRPTLNNPTDSSTPPIHDRAQGQITKRIGLQNLSDQLNQCYRALLLGLLTLKRAIGQGVVALGCRWTWLEAGIMHLCRLPFARQYLKIDAIAYAYLARKSPELRLADLKGYQLWVDLSEYQGIFLYFFGKSLEPFTSQIAATLVRPGNVCIDLGANMGSYTFLLAERVGATGQVYGFEPQPVLFSLLARSVAANRWESRVQLESYAVAAQSHKQLRLYVSGDSCNSGIASMVLYGDSLHADHFIEPETMALDDYCAQRKIDVCHLLKVDIEGAEFLALQGMQQLLREQRIDHLIIEQATGSEAEQLLLDCGYMGWFIDESAGQLCPLNTLDSGCFGNYLFTRAEQAALIAQQFLVCHAAQSIH
ncbi:MAG: FkbM family methyltransferase [Spirulina sp. SIO3F2]|nr:FkbM family methyltransferase [Spirulina sp. SIO3F2]